MDAKSWEKKIVAQAKKDGAYDEKYKPHYSLIADALEQYDEAKAVYEENGRAVLLTQTNKRGFSHTGRNPALMTMLELRKQIFELYGKLGMLPDVPKTRQSGEKKGALAALLEEMKEDG